MAKICNKEGCNNPVFSHNFCSWHQHCRTDDKYKQRINKLKSNNLKVKPTGEAKLFNEIYQENLTKWKSQISGRWLYGPKHYLFFNQFSHLLAKGKYPKYRLNKDNIWHIHPEEHTLIDQGTKALRTRYEEVWKCSFDKYFEKVEQLKQLYNEK